MKKIKKIKATYFKQIDDRLFVLESDSSPLYVYNNCIHFHLIKKVGHNYGGGLYRINDNIVDMSFNGLNIDSLDKISFFMTNEFYFNNMNKRYLIVNKLLREFKAEHYLIEIYNFEIVKKIHYKGTIRLFTQSNNIISSLESSIFCYKDFSLLWQKDISDFLHQNEEAEIQIKEVYLYENSLIVVAKGGIVRLNIENGELIWRTDNYALTMEIVDNYGYVCTGLSLYRVDLDNGETFDYGREYARLPDFEYEGKSYWASGYRVIYYEGLLWYAVYTSGYSFILAINPYDANYEWIHQVDTYEKVEKIQFHQDKMFVSDTGGNLFIYEKDNS